MEESPKLPVVHVADRAGVDKLAQILFDDVRTDVVVVVSTSGKASAPYLDVQWLTDELEDSARIAVLDSASVALHLTQILGDERLSVFGGAGRVYPPGGQWRSDPYAAPLFFCYPGQGRLTAEKIASCVRLMSYRPGAAVVPRIDADVIETTAEVIGCPSDSQVLVRTEDGLTCKMLAVHLYPGVEAGRLVRKGQRLSGKERIATLIGDFFPDPVDDDPRERAQQEFPDGSVSLALVESVTPVSSKLVLHPDVPVELLHREEDLTFLFSQGDVVPVELIWEEGRVLADLARFAEAGPAMSLLPGGPPWLRPDEMGPEDMKGADGETEHPLEFNDLVMDPDEATATISLLTDLQKRNESVIEQLRTEIRAMKKERRETQASQRPRVHADDGNQFRFELQLSYLTRVPESERLQYPLGEYFLGRGFLVSLNSLVAAGGIGRDKVVDVCADVVCGRAAAISSRGVKPWLTSKRGPQEMRPDGAAAWRIRLQVNSSSARRMKYWIRTDRSVEFDSVGVHDDGI